MFKTDQVKNLFDCEQCNQLLVDPVTLSCGYSVCKSHLDGLLKNTPKEMNKFECELCKEKHCIPEKGYAINKRIQNGLNIKLSTLKLNPVYEECKTEINEDKMNIQMIKNLDKDLENLIYEYFEELKRQADLWREALKLKLCNCSDEILQSIEITKENRIKLSKETRRLRTEMAIILGALNGLYYLIRIVVKFQLQFLSPQVHLSFQLFKIFIKIYFRFFKTKHPFCLFHFIRRHKKL